MKKMILLFLLSSGLCAENFVPVEDPMPGKWFLDTIKYTRPQVEKTYREKLDKLDAQPERARCAELHHQLIEEYFVSNRREEEAIEKALNWPKGDFTWHNNKFYTRAGCTSWIITPEVSATGTCMVQKNRDYRRQNLLSVRLFRSAPGRYKVLTVNDLWNTGAGAAMNEKGLMIVQNDPASREFHTRKVNTGSLTVMRYVAEHCANLTEAAATLKKFYTSGICRSGSIYLLADFNSGMIIEATARHIAEARVDFSYEVRANNFLLPGLLQYSRRTQKSHLNGANRRFTASEFLRNTVLEKGKIAPVDLMKLARLRDPEQEKAGFRQVCMKDTLASTMFVPDRMYPEYLSAAFVALGPPRHTLFLPVPMGVTALPESLTDSRWGTKALQLAEKLSVDHPYVKEFETLENKFIKEFFDMREQARKLLIQGKNAQAQKLLDTLLRKQYTEAFSCLSAVEKKSAEQAARTKRIQK
ncbi:MAG: hypothetical protein IKB99_02865 [Lentisphaeria bacterium]|nr:hypothetical protein [Lentisphaeria bacterium]